MGSGFLMLIIKLNINKFFNYDYLKEILYFYFKFLFCLIFKGDFNSLEINLLKIILFKII